MEQEDDEAGDLEQGILHRCVGKIGPHLQEGSDVMEETNHEKSLPIPSSKAIDASCSVDSPVTYHVSVQPYIYWFDWNTLRIKITGTSL